MKTVFRYYSTQRPIGPGTYPRNGVEDIVNFDEKKHVPAIDRSAWGYIDYSRELTEREISGYELTFDTEYIDPEIYI